MQVAMLAYTLDMSLPIHLVGLVRQVLEKLKSRTCMTNKSWTWKDQIQNRNLFIVYLSRLILKNFNREHLPRVALMKSMCLIWLYAN